MKTNVKHGFTSLTRHALCRLEERTKIGSDRLRKLLDKGSYINLGVEAVFDRRHCLFYSMPDNECFVAIQDTMTGEVITVLPLDYHENLSFKIDKKLYYKIDKEYVRRAKALVRHDLDPSSMAFKISLKVRYLDDQELLRTHTVLKIPAEEYQNNPQLFIKNKQLIFNPVANWLEDSEAHQVIDIYVSLGRESNPIFLCDEFVDEVNSLIFNA